MATLTIVDAEATATRGRPWTIRMESGCKYWYATGRGLTELAEIGFGNIGQTPDIILADWTCVQLAVAAHTADGYKWADTPYIRMSPESLAKVTGNPIVPIGQTTGVVPPVLPAKPIQQPQRGPQVAKLAIDPNSPVVMCVVRTGIRLDGFVVLNSNGVVLNHLTTADGLEFARKYNLDIQFV